MNPVEIEMVVGLLKSVIALVEAVDPDAAKNKVVIDITAAIDTLQKLGI